MLLDDYMYVCFSHMYSQHNFIIPVFITISNQLTISVIGWSVLFISPSRCAYLKHLLLALSIPFPADIQQSDIMQNADVRVLNHYRLQRLKQDKLFRNVHS